MEYLRDLLDNPESKKGKIFNLFIQAMILLSLISFSIETLPKLSDNTKVILNYIEIITVIIFTIEYLLRIITAEKKASFIFSFYGIIDLLAILPFYIASGIDLRSIRIIRLLRLFRMFKLIRYNKAINHFKNAFNMIRHELLIYFILTIFLIYIASVGIYYFENPVQPQVFYSIFHSMWWAVATLTTVGYGDVYPITVGGKIFTFIILMLGLGIVAIPSGLIASALTKTNDIDEYE